MPQCRPDVAGSSLQVHARPPLRSLRVYPPTAHAYPSSTTTATRRLDRCAARERGATARAASTRSAGSITGRSTSACARCAALLAANGRRARRARGARCSATAAAYLELVLRGGAARRDRGPAQRAAHRRPSCARCSPTATPRVLVHEADARRARARAALAGARRAARIACGGSASAYEARAAQRRAAPRDRAGDARATRCC